MKPTMRFPVLLSMLLVLAGCQAQAVKPETETAQPPQAAPSEAAGDLQSYFMRMVKSNEQVEQRITLMQEQVIKLNQQIQVLQQRNLKMLQTLQQVQIAQQQQHLKSASNSKPTTGDQQDAKPSDNVEDILQRLEQQLAMSGVAASSGKTAAPGFRLVSAYTPKGQWVIFKYDEATGLTWMAKEGGWMEIEEQGRLPYSRYEVVLRPAAGDVKGYVAARVDQQTGESWWLKGNQWAAFQ